MKKILLGFIAIGLFTFVGCGTSSSVEYGEGVTDFKGNTYKSVKIGKQEWMAENLNVNHFKNGEIIPEAQTEEEWLKAGKKKEPAWCYYDNNQANGQKYGKLYNFYAVSDTRGLAPTGWHVPSDSDWNVLKEEGVFSNENINVEAGTALKAKSGWNYSYLQSGNGTDYYGWKGLPGGFRRSDGDLGGIGSDGIWWSYSQVSALDSWTRRLTCADYKVVRRSFSNECGFSVRCVKD